MFKASYLWLTEGINLNVKLLLCGTAIYIHQLLCRLVHTRLCHLTSQHVHTDWTAEPTRAKISYPWKSLSFIYPTKYCYSRLVDIIVIKILPHDKFH